MTKLYIKKIPDRLRNKKLIHACKTDLEKEGYTELLEANKVEKILMVYVKKQEEADKEKSYYSVVFVMENTSEEVDIITVNDDDYKLPGIKE